MIKTNPMKFFENNGITYNSILKELYTDNFDNPYFWDMGEFYMYNKRGEIIKILHLTNKQKKGKIKK